MLFKDIIGQEETRRHLLQEVREQRVAHAQLFCARPGAGALPLAMAYARYLQCERPGAEDACGECPSCLQWNKLVHPDVHFTFPIYKKSATKPAVSDDFIAPWRELLLRSPYFSYAQWLEQLDSEKQLYIYVDESDAILRRFSLKSMAGGYKIGIIWLPEKMYKDNAFGNKLLKLLEEPPAQTLFLLVSEQPEQLLPTILSRTQRIRIPPLSEEEIARALETRYRVDGVESRHLAHLAGGDFTRALEAIHLDGQRQEFFELFVSLMRLSYARNVKEMKRWSEQVAALGREQQKNFLAYAQHLLRENFIYNLHLPALNYMSTPEADFAVRFAPFINEGNVRGILHELSEAARHIEQNVNAKMVFFDFSLKMIVLIKNR
ncbi:MAG: DNA polymerase III subunit delta [Prevotellaceae bacterium]|nr:DNA polymerase III subunit delta [Prevotellaceae bacterium]